MRWKVSLTMVLITIINVKGVMAQSDHGCRQIALTP